MADGNESEFGGTGYKAPAGQGVEAPLAQETGGPAEMSVFDGEGNESVVVMAPSEEDGRRVQGTGATREEALANSGGESILGEDFSPGTPVDHEGTD